MQDLKQSTAFTERVGPVLDPAGAEYGGLVIGDLSISKNGTTAAMAATATLTYDANGYYSLVGTTGNSDTLGRLTITCNKAGYQMPPREFMVRPATVWDLLNANAAGGANGFPLADANNGVKVSVGTGAGQLNPSGGKIPATIAAGDIAANAVDANAVKADAVTKIQAGLPAAIWDHLESAATTVGSIGKKLVDLLAALTTTRAAKLDRLPASGTVAVPGDAMALTEGERDAVAVEVESHLLDEGDSQLLINAIVGAIGNTNVDQAVLVAAIRADLERTGGNLNTLIARFTAQRATNLDNLDAAVSGIPGGTAAQITSDHGAGSYVRNTEPDNTGIGNAVSQATSAATNTTDLPSMVETSGGHKRFKANALEQAPSGGGGGGGNVTVDEFTDDALEQLREARVAVTQYDPETDPIRIYRGIDHLSETANGFGFSSDDWPDLTACTVRMELIIAGITAVAGSGTITDAGEPTQQVYVEVLQDAFDESAIKNGTGIFRVVRINGTGKRFPLANGIATLFPNTAPAA